MKDRLNNFLLAEKLTPARFAEIISVRPSNISHIISGRNKPGFDFIEKMLNAFPELNAEWLLLGTGKMYKGATESLIFDSKELKLFDNPPESTEKQEYKDENPLTENITNKMNILPELGKQNAEIERVIICYSDNTFDFYFPR